MKNYLESHGTIIPFSEIARLTKKDTAYGSIHLMILKTNYFERPDAYCLEPNEMEQLKQEYKAWLEQQASFKL